jgi:asparagine synthase (glutamine-hydrolysing)
MCGIVGFIERGGLFPLEKTIRDMTATLQHRGPDAQGIWIDDGIGIAFGHRRLSIVDLSPLGAQPMEGATSRFLIVFNGEIYNFKEIATELTKRGHHFRGSSDTEVLLAAFEEWGVVNSLSRLNGMFAFAVWDKKARELILARDRLGKKPLYYGTGKGVFFFGSELKALRANPGFEGDIERSIIPTFLQFGFIPSPYSIYKNIFKLPPGTCLTLPLQLLQNSHAPLVAPDRLGNQQLALHSYWNPRTVIPNIVSARKAATASEAIEELHPLLLDAVRIRMLADVPLGAFLSGGIDSSTVVALMQAQSTYPVKTFSIGFSISNYNEAHYAKKIAAHLGTDHTEIYVEEQHALEVVPRLPWMFDEPFADASQIPTYLVSKLARQKVTVALSGDGGDEIFAGYNRYIWGTKLLEMVQVLPAALRTALSTMIHIVPVQSWDKVLWLVGRLLPLHYRYPQPGHKLNKLARFLTFKNPTHLYELLLSNAFDTENLCRDPITQHYASNSEFKFPSFTEQMMFDDLIRYLPDDILVKVDRASMGASLEARAPFLDYRVIEAAWRYPLSLHMKEGRSKALLRTILAKYVPPELFERPKMGFGVPLGKWLRGELRDWAEAQLAPQRLQAEGLLNADEVQKRWRDHLAGRRNHEYGLWNLLMFQSWMETQSAGMAAMPTLHTPQVFHAATANL